ncbi:MAG: Bro-N domain-containing protein [Pararhodobacter sp.]
MSAEIIPFDFEEQAVRVLMRGDDPWFVAVDVCRVLELSNPSMAVKGLDDDEVTLSQIEGSHRETNLISESGLYALVIRSDKPAARRFRKWITAEVLPAIRRTGRYELHAAPADADATGEFAGLPIREAELWLSLVREARLTRGRRAALAIWDRSPLPAPLGQRPGPGPEQGRAALRALLSGAIAGRELGDLIEAARAGEFDAARLLASQGLRLTGNGLFIANHAAGDQRDALLALPGVLRADGGRTLAGRKCRGLVIPFTVIGGA